MKRGLVIALCSTLLAACAATSSSTPVAPGGAAWTGPVLVTASPVPQGVEYTVVGSVQADAKAGYDKADTLYPMLAAEAKKMGANAVVSAKGGHRVSAFSWAAPYVSGMAIKVKNPDALKSLGSYY